MTAIILPIIATSGKIKKAVLLPFFIMDPAIVAPNVIPIVGAIKKYLFISLMYFSGHFYLAYMIFAIGPSLNNAEPMLMPARTVAIVMHIKNGQFIILISPLNLSEQHLQHRLLCSGCSSSISPKSSSESSGSDESELESVDF